MIMRECCNVGCISFHVVLSDRSTMDYCSTVLSSTCTQSWLHILRYDCAASTPPSLVYSSAACWTNCMMCTLDHSQYVHIVNAASMRSIHCICACLNRRKAQAQSEAQRRVTAATSLQCWHRRVTATARVRAAARAIIVRCLDAETGAPFYFNPRTGTSAWAKPAFMVSCSSLNVLRANMLLYTMSCLINTCRALQQ
jgi:hypothetical protein